jgi:Relaxase/Mobilisation nuclease domain
MVNGSLSRDSLEYERRGRAVGENHYREAMRARARELLRIGERRSGISRSGGTAPTPSASARRTTSNETVLKVISWTKSQRAPLAQARYAARTRQGDASEASLPMINEEGRVLQGGDVEVELRSWDLKPDRENLSPAARRAGARERAMMPDRERLQRRQAAHLILSIPAHARADADRLDRAVKSALAETLGEGGFRYVYAIHTDHSSRPHAHIIVKAQSEPFRARSGETTSRQLRLDPAELEAMRQVFTRHAQAVGLNVTATRREDRDELRHEILAGRAPLRANHKRHQTTLQTRQGRTFERRAPRWYAEHGYEYERRRLKAAEVEPAANVRAEGTPQRRPSGFIGRLMSRLGLMREQEPSEARSAWSVSRHAGGYFLNFENYRKGVEASERRISDHFGATHREADRAAESFRLMLRDAPSLALWAANHHPIAFGEPTGATGPGLQPNDVRAVIRAAHRRQSADHAATRVDQRIIDSERMRLREATFHARAMRRVERPLAAITRSLERVASGLEGDAATDPGALGNAAEIRKLVQSKPFEKARDGKQALSPDRARLAGREEPRSRSASQYPRQAAQYKRLEDDLRQREAARSKRKTRDRDVDGPPR